MALHCSVMFALCLLCHFNLQKLRPPDSSQLGTYYLRIALGGWLGTALLALGAPLALGPLALPHADYIVAAAVVLAAYLLRDKRPLRAWLVGAALLLAAVAGLTALRRDRVYAVRSFYGLLQVTDEGDLRVLHHGDTVHGIQRKSGDRSEPLVYYHHDSPIGRLFAKGLAGSNVAVIGLGAGSLASYGKEGDRFVFYELDPKVVKIAREYFDFVSHSAAKVNIIEGDARLTFTGAPDGGYSLVVVDAFSSDFVPTHLITREAMQLYFSKLRPS